MVRVIRPGADGNLVAMGKSGNLYQFYVRGEGANTKVITDMSVDIMVAAARGGNGMPANMAGLSRTASASDLKVEADWLRTIGFKPDNIVHSSAERREGKRVSVRVYPGGLRTIKKKNMKT